MPNSATASIDQPLLASRALTPSRANEQNGGRKSRRS
jgi:hypothetical protein